MKEHEETKKLFEVGCVALLGDYRVVIVECNQDENNEWVYKVRPIDVSHSVNLLVDKVPQSVLEPAVWFSHEEQER